MFANERFFYLFAENSFSGIEIKTKIFQPQQGLVIKKKNQFDETTCFWMLKIKLNLKKDMITALFCRVTFCGCEKLKTIAE